MQLPPYPLDAYIPVHFYRAFPHQLFEECHRPTVATLQKSNSLRKQEKQERGIVGKVNPTAKFLPSSTATRLVKENKGRPLAAWMATKSTKSRTLLWKRDAVHLSQSREKTQLKNSQRGGLPRRPSRSERRGPAP